MKAQIFKFSLFLVINIFFCSVSWSKTLTETEFHGVWSTANSYLKPKRQILEFNSDGGKWTRIAHDGEPLVVIIKKSDITFIDDILIFSAQEKDSDIKFKFVLAGWGQTDSKNIFGSVYLYQNREADFELFNGFPVSFKNGIEHAPPQVLWNYFSGPEREKVDAAYIRKLEAELKSVSFMVIGEDENWILYSAPKLNKFVFIAKENHPAYPAAIGYSGIYSKSKEIRLISKYTGKESDFKKYENKIKDDLLLEMNHQLKMLDNILNKI